MHKTKIYNKNGLCEPQQLGKALYQFAQIVAIALTTQLATASDSVWYQLLTTNGTKIGHQEKRITRNETGLIVTDTLVVLTRQKEQPTVSVKVAREYAEDATGRPLYARRSSKIGRLVKVIEATVIGNEVTVKRNTIAGQEESWHTVPTATRFDGGDFLISTWDFEKTPILTFNQFDLETETIQRVVVKPVQTNNIFDVLKVIRSVYVDQQLIGQSQLEFDHKRTLMVATSSYDSLEMTLERTDKNTAMRKNVAYESIKDQSIKSPYKISKRALNGHIRYKFSLTSGEPFSLPETPNQRVTVSGNQVIVDLCAGCGPTVSVSEQELETALQATKWLQSDDPRIQERIRRIKRKRISDARKMRKFEALVAKKLPKLEFNGHASAAEALVNRRGDCTEYALLLAAFGRAAGIPTRVINGLSYSRARYHGVSNVFIPHAWVEAHIDGTWQTFDAALGGFDASRIALTINEGEPQGFVAAGRIARKLVWEELAQIKTVSAVE